MAEGLSATEVGKGLAEHAEHAEHRLEASAHRHAHLITIIEAVLLSVVTITAAWTGYSAAKWQTESSLSLAKASAARTAASRAFQQSLTFRAQDAADFNAWFAAYLAGSRQDAQVAEHRFRPEYGVAFRAWLATRPFTDANAPKGPQYMPQYKPTGQATSEILDARATALYNEGAHAATTADDYIRVTVILASVLFLVGISSHFTLTSVRWGLVSVGAVLVVVAAVSILRLPGPP